MATTISAMSVRAAASVTWSLGRGRSRFVAAVVVLAVGMLALGYVGSEAGRYSVLLGVAVLIVGIACYDRSVLILLAVPGTLVVARVGGGTSNLSASDFILFMATLACLPVVRLREAPEIRRLLTVVAFYQATTVLTVLDNPYRADIVEWVHEALLVAGSLVVGWVIGREGKARTALSSYVVLACAMALWSIEWTLTHHLQPTYLPFGMQKNYIGDMLAFAAVISFANPPWFGWKQRRRRIAIAVLLAGMLSCQSKQAIIATAIGVVVLVLRDHPVGRRPKGIFLLLVPLLGFTYYVVSREVSSHNRFNSVYQRVTWLHQSIQIWDHSKLVGVGLRWW